MEGNKYLVGESIGGDFPGDGLDEQIFSWSVELTPPSLFPLLQQENPDSCIDYPHMTYLLLFIGSERK